MSPFQSGSIFGLFVFADLPIMKTQTVEIE